ncbi:uncharacterized protein LOC129305896 isoform X2 [Prosopis cineraria]|uniref:uncharacterized protein LOC129305896 isoform X2 n=1 Tax=Prosopis cineraria TaxID=364024 RepID=UPI0024100045|nr:uncharacterized protein LOC129305896 isoform X2 [Prosopis cineraria]
MRRQNSICEIPDSDQSISEEEDSDDVGLEIAVSLDPSAKNQEELPLPVRLDFLRGSSRRSLDGNGSSCSFEKPTGVVHEDEVELPDFEEVELSRFSGEIAANSSDEEVISEDEGKTVLPRIIIGSRTKGRELYKYGACSIRSEQVGHVNEEYEALLHAKGSVSSSKANRCSDGIWGKAVPKFSKQSLSHEHEPSGASISNCDETVPFKIHGLPQATETVSPGISACSIESFLEDDDEVGNISETQHTEQECPAHGLNLHSMADLVDNLQDKAYSNLPHYCQKRGKKVKHFPIRSRSLLQDRSNGGDSPEPMDSGSSSGNEVSDQNTKIAFPEKKMQTMADRFQQALGASRVTDEGTCVAALKSFGAGIFGNLQRVMQREKERDADFLKRSQAGASQHGVLGGVDVKIISRYLDGKLIVCCCLFCKYTEEFLLPGNSERMMCEGHEGTVIFNPRVSDVDLEVGNMIRIHPPWKQVPVGNDNIMLCTYFSEIPCPD